MAKEIVIAQFNKTHNELISYIDQLTDAEFMHSKNAKWTPGQQLDHIFLCLKPITQALSSKSYIEQKFGTIQRPTFNYDEVISNYNTALAKGGKAPDRFVPETVELDRKKELATNTYDILKAISQQLNTYSEKELDSLVLPHPLLGDMTINELFYLMTYHATHHLDQTKQNLVN